MKSQKRKLATQTFNNSRCSFFSHTGACCCFFAKPNNAETILVSTIIHCKVQLPQLTLFVINLAAVRIKEKRCHHSARHYLKFVVVESGFLHVMLWAFNCTSNPLQRKTICAPADISCQHQLIILSDICQVERSGLHLIGFPFITGSF